MARLVELALNSALNRRLASRDAVTRDDPIPASAGSFENSHTKRTWNAFRLAMYSTFLAWGPFRALCSGVHKGWFNKRGFSNLWIEKAKLLNPLLLNPRLRTPDMCTASVLCVFALRFDLPREKPAAWPLSDEPPDTGSKGLVNIYIYIYLYIDAHTNNST